MPPPLGKVRICANSLGNLPFKICEYPFTGYITLNYEGMVAPCCRLTNVVHMGDLKTQSFSEIWNGDFFKKLRSMMIEGEYPSYCHDRCNYRVEMQPEPAGETPGKLRARPEPQRQDEDCEEASLIQID